MPIKVIDIIVERRGMILLTKRGDYWILPGGEIEPGDDELNCLEDVVAKEIERRTYKQASMPNPPPPPFELISESGV